VVGIIRVLAPEKVLAPVIVCAESSLEYVRAEVPSCTCSIPELKPTDPFPAVGAVVGISRVLAPEKVLAPVMVCAESSLEYVRAAVPSCTCSIPELNPIEPEVAVGAVVGIIKVLTPEKVLAPVTVWEVPSNISPDPDPTDTAVEPFQY